MLEYKPYPRTAEILNWVLAKVGEVPYEVPLRWAFYRVVQEKGLEKDNYGDFKKWTSRARKRFWNGWAPNTLVDDTREICESGGGYDTTGQWFESFKHHRCLLDKRYSQEWLVLVWFESRDMLRQFIHYSKPYYVPLAPFGGDASIHYKWRLAKMIEELQRYRKPIKVLYFGDWDKKGQEIPENAQKDIQAWCNIPYDFEWRGLTEEQVEKWKIPENPDKPGQYQWEALDDEAAKQIIITALDDYLDIDAIKEVEYEERKATEKWREMLDQIS